VEEKTSSSETNGPNETKGLRPGVTEPEGTENSGDSLTELSENLSLVCSTTNPGGRKGAVDKGESTEIYFLVCGDDTTAETEVYRRPNEPRFKALWGETLLTGTLSPRTRDRPLRLLNPRAGSHRGDPGRRFGSFFHPYTVRAARNTSLPSFLSSRERD